MRVLQNRRKLALINLAALIIAVAAARQWGTPHLFTKSLEDRTDHAGNALYSVKCLYVGIQGHVIVYPRPWLDEICPLIKMMPVRAPNFGEPEKPPAPRIPYTVPGRE